MWPCLSIASVGRLGSSGNKVRGRRKGQPAVSGTWFCFGGSRGVSWALGEQWADALRPQEDPHSVVRLYLPLENLDKAPRVKWITKWLSKAVHDMVGWEPHTNTLTRPMCYRHGLQLLVLLGGGGTTKKMTASSADSAIGLLEGSMSPGMFLRPQTETPELITPKSLLL